MTTLKLAIFSILFFSSLAKCELPDNIFSLFLSKFSENLFKDVGDSSDDLGLDVYGFLAKHEYPFEIHHVTSEDGYILTLQRIVAPQEGSNQTLKVKNKPAVILQHGLSSCCMDFINKGPGTAIGLMLADAGWDVWLKNDRGNRYSRKHTTLDPDRDPEFWNYSWEECGYYDIPAVIDHIRNVTGHKKVAYIGHSQGTTQFFAMGALRPEYNDKVSVMAALAPVAYMGQLTSPLVKMAAFKMNLLEPLLVDVLNMSELVPYRRSNAAFVEQYCADGTKTQELCALLLFLTCGFNTKQMDRSFLPFGGSNTPAGMSVNMIIHYGQEILSGHFRRFDHGEEGNMKMYNSKVPPDYNVTAISAPVGLFYSKNDLFTGVADVERFAKELGNLAKFKLIDDKYFSHIDFVWAKDVVPLLNNDLIEFLAKYADDDDDDSSAPRNTYCITFVLIVSLVLSYMNS